MKSSVGTRLAHALAAGVFVASFAGSAIADSYKDDPTVSAGRKLEWSFNIGATSDYVFRGQSQTAGDPTIQGGLDFSYGLFYAGVWGSGVDFGNATNQANAEIDIYGGVKHSFGPVDLDLGLIYYLYAGTKNEVTELDYVEFKLGASTTIQKISLGVTGFYSPEYTGETGPAIIVEGTAGYELPSFQAITPSISGAIGTVQFEEAGNINYTYWNAGLSLTAAEKLTLDFRYWDTDGATSDCGTAVFGCDERFVASVKVTLP